MNYPNSNRGSRVVTLPRCMAGEATTSSSCEDMSIDEERTLLRFYEGQMVGLCSTLRYPPKVRITALHFFKRFFLVHSPMQHDLMRTMLTCIYLSGKTEEAYIGAEEFCRQCKQDPKSVLGYELTLLTGLGFDLIIHSPHRSLEGFIEDLTTCPLSDLDDEAMHQPSEERSLKWFNASMSAIDSLMLSDAPLVFPPSHLALAALRSGLKKAEGIKLGNKYLDRVSRRSPSCPSLESLSLMLDEIDKFGMQGAQKVEVGVVQGIDKKQKIIRSLLASMENDEEGEKEKAAKREAKLKARKEEQAAKERQILGIATTK